MPRLTAAQQREFYAKPFFVDTCPKCGKGIQPAEMQRLSSRQSRCPHCGETYTYPERSMGMTNPPIDHDAQAGRFAKGGSRYMHRVHLRFERLFEQWKVRFVDLEGSDRLREYTFDNFDKVERLAERGNGLRDLAAKQGMDSARRNGMGGIELRLTDDQYGKLKR